MMPEETFEIPDELLRQIKEAEMGLNLCRFCDGLFGDHREDCPVKFRDQTNPDPEVQRQHEMLDVYYETQDPGELVD